MKKLSDFLNESLVSERMSSKYSVDFKDIRNEHLDKYNELKKSVGLKRENQLPTEKQFNQMIDLIIRDNDEEFAQSFIQLFTYEYGQDESFYNHYGPEIDPTNIYMLGWISKNIPSSDIQKYDMCFQKLLRKFNLKSIKDFPDYRTDAIKLCKKFNIDAKVDNIEEIVISRSKSDYCDELLKLQPNLAAWNFIHLHCLSEELVKRKKLTPQIWSDLKKKVEKESTELIGEPWFDEMIDDIDQEVNK